MPTLQELNAKVDELTQSVNNEQQQVADLLAEKETTNQALQANIVTLNETIATLEGQIADGGTAEERQAIVDKLTALKEDIESTVAP